MLGLNICLVGLQKWITFWNKPKVTRLNNFFFFIDKHFMPSLFICKVLIGLSQLLLRKFGRSFGLWKLLSSFLFYNGAWKNMAMNDTTTAKRNTQIQIWFNTRAAFLHSSRLASRIMCCWTLSARILLALFLSPGTWPRFLLLFDWLIPFVSLATRISLSFTAK